MVFETVAALISERMGCAIEDVKMETQFQELSIDSLETVEIMMELEEKYGREFEIDQKLETVADLVHFIEERIGE